MGFGRQKKESGQKTRDPQAVYMDAGRNLAQATGQDKTYVQENYLAPPQENQPPQLSEEGKVRLEEDLRADLNPEIPGGKQQLQNILLRTETILNGVTEQIRQEAAKAVVVARQVLSETKEGTSQSSIPSIQEYHASFERSAKEPENLELAQQNILEGRVIAENHERYNLILEHGIPKEIANQFIEQRAEAEGKILDDPTKSIAEKEQALSESRKEATKELLRSLHAQGFDIKPLESKFDTYIKLATDGGKILNSNPENYGAALHAETLEEYNAVLERSNLEFLIAPPIFSLGDLMGDAEEIDPSDFAAQDYMNELDKLQLQMDETQLLAEINEAVAALSEEEEETAGEERTIADLEEEKQKELEDLGLDSKTTVKEANELIKKVQEQQAQVQRLRSPDMFVKDEEGKWVLTEEAGDGQEVSYAKNPPFYSQEVTQRILKDSQSIIEENPNQFYQLAAIELGGDGRFNMGTLYDILRGNLDLDNAEAPEVVALEYLRDPSNAEAKESFNQMIQDPKNNGIRVAVAEAFARAAGKLMNEHMSNAEKNF